MTLLKWYHSDKHKTFSGYKYKLCEIPFLLHRVVGGGQMSVAIIIIIIITNNVDIFIYLSTILINL